MFERLSSFASELRGTEMTIQLLHCTSTGEVSTWSDLGESESVMTERAAAWRNQKVAPSV